MRHTSLTSNDVAKERYCQHWGEWFLFHMMSAISIVLTDGAIWFVSLQAHTLPFITVAIITAMTVVGGAWWVIRTIRGDIAYCNTDFAINCGIALGMVFSAWILLFWVQACVATGLVVVWIVLIRAFPSFPLQYRTKKRVSVSLARTQCAMCCQDEQQCALEQRQEGAVVRASAALAADRCWRKQCSQRLRIIVRQQRAKVKGEGSSSQEEIRSLNSDQLAMQAAQDYLAEGDPARHLSQYEIIAIFRDEFRQFFGRS
jgi:hypothetical protein